MSMLYGGPAHIKLVVEWEPEVKAKAFGVVADDIPDPQPSVHELRQRYQQPLTANLHDCLNIYTKEETVSKQATLSTVRTGGLQWSNYVCACIMLLLPHTMVWSVDTIIILRQGFGLISISLQGFESEYRHSH